MLLGVAVLVVFAVYEAQPAVPIAPNRLFRSKAAKMTMAGGFIHGMILVSRLQYILLLYQAVALETVIASAIFLLPTVIISVVVTAGSMMMVSVVGGYVWILRLS
jgi:hypothetical protein